MWKQGRENTQFQNQHESNLSLPSKAISTSCLSLSKLHFPYKNMYNDNSIILDLGNKNKLAQAQVLNKSLLAHIGMEFYKSKQEITRQFC